MRLPVPDSRADDVKDFQSTSYDQNMYHSTLQWKKNICV